MKKIKNDNGITLVALVVTIVVMLILAGISVNLVIGDNGIIKVTKQIKNNTIQAESEAQEKINNLKGQEKYTADGTKIISDENAPIINSLKITQLTNSSFKVSINITEKESGIREIRYSKNDGENYETDPTNNKSKSFIYSDINPGTYQIKVRVEDNNEKSSEASTNFEVVALFEEKSDEMLNKNENTTLVIDEKEITIPAGYKIAEDSADTIDEGIVITDAAEDGNEWVWVPVEDVSAMCEMSDTPIALQGDTGITTTKYSKSEIISEQTREIPGRTSGYHEPDLVIDYDIDENAQTAGFENQTDMATKLANDYETMIASIEQYKGFYIGRYELTADGEKAGETLTNNNWYQLYAECKNLAASDKAVTRMIWGCQWDVTCNWIENYGDRKSITDSSSWGNYSNYNTANNYSEGDTGYVSGAGSKQDTGYSDFWKANNIYDFAGNCWEWTQEAYITGYRASRGGNFNYPGSNIPASCRVGNKPTYGDYSFERFSRYFNSATMNARA